MFSGTWRLSCISSLFNAIYFGSHCVGDVSFWLAGERMTGLNLPSVTGRDRETSHCRSSSPCQNHFLYPHMTMSKGLTVTAVSQGVTAGNEIWSPEKTDKYIIIAPRTHTTLNHTSPKQLGRNVLTYLFVINILICLNLSVLCSSHGVCCACCYSLFRRQCKTLEM